MATSRDNGNSGLALFADELRAARAASGLTRDELAAKINYSPSLIAMIESLRRAPQLVFATGRQGVQGTGHVCQAPAARPDNPAAVMVPAVGRDRGDGRTALDVRAFTRARPAANP